MKANHFASLTLFSIAMFLHGSLKAADPIHVGQWPGYPRGGARAVAVAGNYAYVAALEGGMQVIDISNPSNPHRVASTISHAQGVALTGNYAYVAGGSGFDVIDISNPTSPTRVAGDSQGFLPGGCQNVTVARNRAYVTGPSGPDWLLGLAVFDIADPIHPVKLGEYHGSSPWCQYPGALEVSGNYAYLPPTEINGQKVVSISTTNTRAFFRLRGQ